MVSIKICNGGLLVKMSPEIGLSDNFKAGSAIHIGSMAPKRLKNVSSHSSTAFKLSSRFYMKSHIAKSIMGYFNVLKILRTWR